MEQWLGEVLACPSIGADGQLSYHDRDGWRCEASGLAYPVLGGVPILLSEPARWLAQYRDAVVASLAEHGLADEHTMALLGALTEPFRDETPEPFRDDWTKAEWRGETTAPAPIQGPAKAALSELLSITDQHGALMRLSSEVAQRTPRTVLEVGPGAGLLTAQLATCCQRLLIVDHSLRAVLRACDRARASNEASVVGVVLDADALTLRPSCVDVVVSANLLDLLDQPEQFVDTVASGLKSGGALITSTPRPALQGGADDELLVELLQDAGLSVVVRHDGLPWLRCHSPREYQVFLCQVLVAEKQ